MDDDEHPEWWWTPPFTGEPLSIEVEVTPNEVVGTFYGTDGEPLFEVYERPWVPFGFQRGGG